MKNFKVCKVSNSICKSFQLIVSKFEHFQRFSKVANFNWDHFKAVVVKEQYFKEF